MELIRWIAKRFPRLSRSELASTVCENLPWKAPNGQPWDLCLSTPARKWAAIGVIHLPPKGERMSRRRAHRSVLPLPALALSAPLAALRPVSVEPVGADDRALWNATMVAHHPWGFARAVARRRHETLPSGTRPRRLFRLDGTRAVALPPARRRPELLSRPPGCAGSASGQPCPRAGYQAASGRLARTLWLCAHAG